MAYNETLADRIAELLLERDIVFEEKKMFGGIVYMINDKMSLGVIKDELMLRVLDEKYENIKKIEYAKPMEFTGREMKGFVTIEERGLSTNNALQKWIDFGVEFSKSGIVKSKKK
jgi:TfoX/Sxy family transcriptional regulator of competence genes